MISSDLRSGGRLPGELSNVVPGLVSTIIPVHNRPRLVVEAVESVLAQTYRPIEILVVDDGSTDDTPRVLEDLSARHPEVRTVRQENAGPGRARETGRLLARGEYLQYLDSDDLLLPRKFELQVEALRARPDCGVAYGFTRYRPASGPPHESPWKGSGQRVETMFPSFLNERWWDTPTPLYRRSVTDLAGPWTDLSWNEDWEYDCRIAALGTRLAFCEAFVAEVRDQGASALSRTPLFDQRKTRSRAKAHVLVYQHARRAGIDPDHPAMQRYARALFLLARQAGAAGLAAESRELFALAREASGPSRARGWDFRIYRLGAALVGWRAAGWLTSRGHDPA